MVPLFQSFVSELLQARQWCGAFTPNAWEEAKDAKEPWVSTFYAALATKVVGSFQIDAR